MVEVCEEIPGWKDRQASSYRTVLAEKDALIKEMGQSAANVLIRDASALRVINRLRKVIMVAQKP